MIILNLLLRLLNKNHSLITCSRSLPDDLIMEILSWLPVTTLLRFKSASKSFFNLILSPEFVKLHLHRSLIRNSSVTLLHSGKAFLASFNVNHPRRLVVQLGIDLQVIKLIEPFRYYSRNNEFYIPKIIGVCNGVVGFNRREEFVLYNPATRVYKQVPRANASRRLYHNEFVYDCVSDDFKIFSFIESRKIFQIDSETYMYSLKNNSWSKIDDPPPGYRIDKSCNHIASNYLHWINGSYDSKPDVIVRFNVSSHGYEEMSFPNQVIMSSWLLRLGVLNGRLHVMSHGNSFDIWMLKEDDSWTQVFRCSEWKIHAKHCLFYSINGRKIFLRPEKKPRNLICCDLDSQTTSVVQILGLPEGDTFRAIPWVESLVPLS